MKKFNRKRLDNKGFTLIELLAVVVILAVVMGIAMTSVLTAMNKSRGGSLQDSAMVIANAFNQKYTESLVGGVPSDVFAGGTNEPLSAGKGYNFQSSAVYYLDKALANTFNITENGYAFVNSTTTINVNAVASTVTNEKLAPGTEIKNSIVSFNATTGKFVVCLFANTTGSYYVDNYKTQNATTAVGSTGMKAAQGQMFACSDSGKSWK